MYFTEKTSNLEGPEQLLLCSCAHGHEYQVTGSSPAFARSPYSTVPQWWPIRSTGDRWGDLYQSLESSGGDATEDEEDEEISVGAQPSKLLDKGFGRWYIR